MEPAFPFPLMRRLTVGLISATGPDVTNRAIIDVNSIVSERNSCLTLILAQMLTPWPFPDFCPQLSYLGTCWGGPGRGPRGSISGRVGGKGSQLDTDCPSHCIRRCPAHAHPSPYRWRRREELQSWLPVQDDKTGLHGLITFQYFFKKKAS